jgi:hypothetical protein
MAFHGPTTIKINKMDAAKRQLRTAIELWFMEADPVAIHTLAFASHEIIHALYRRIGLSDLLFDSDLVKDEHRREFGHWIRSDAAFFKHGRKDPDGVTNFNTAVNEMILAMSVAGLQRMGEPPELPERVFLQWLLIHRPTWFDGDRLGDRLPVDALAKVTMIGKKNFYEACCVLFGQPDP